MRIRSWVVTAVATACAAAGLGVVVVQNNPLGAGSSIYLLFWVSLLFTLWGLLTTVLLFCRMNLTQSVWVGLTWASGLCAVAVTRQQGMRGGALLGGTLSATLALSLFLWWRFRHGRT